MSEASRDFVHFMIEQNVLQFGEFTLKSGRQSPYFFNLGNISSGTAFRWLGQAYAAKIESENLRYDMLFGPAYKGIPIATATAIALQQDASVAFNRKEAKTHGEGGVFIGAPVQGSVLIVDDVLTAGTAVLEAKEMIEAQGAQVAGVIIALDRKERLGEANETAVQRMRREYGLDVTSIVDLEDVIDYLDSATDGAEDFQNFADAIRAYQQEHCVI